MNTKSKTGITAATIILVGLIFILSAEIGFSLYRPQKLIARVPFATLDVISGNIKVQAKDSLTWETAKQGMLLEPGDRIKTSASSRGFITFSQGTATTLEPNSDLVITKLADGQNEQLNDILLEQLLGKTWTQVSGRADGASYFQIQTSSALVKVHGTLFTTEVDQDGKTNVQTTEGNLSVSAQGHEVNVPAGKQTSVEPGEVPSLLRVIPPARNELVFSVAKDAEGLVVAPGGTKIGNLADRQTINQIAGARIIQEDSAYQTIRIPEPEMGEYAIVLQGAAGDSISYSVEGYTNGERTFQLQETANVTSVNQTLLKLHVDVLDGLMKEVSKIGSRSETPAIATAASSLQPGQKSMPSTLKDIASDSLPAVPQREKNTLYFFSSEYSTGARIIILGVVALLGLIAVVIWRKT